MNCLSDKTLPNENSDYSLPGRFEDSNGYYAPVEPKEKSRALMIGMVAFVLVSAGFFSYYFINQNEIDSQIMHNTALMTSEQKMAIKYNVGKFGSDHSHAALAVFVDGVQVNFGLSQFQIQSKYIHFENHNPYLIHKHATNVPLEMLFSSFGFRITSECMKLSNVDMGGKEFCIDSENSMVFVINGKYYSDIISYEINQNDRILISFGDSGLVSEQIKYLESLEIHEVPKKNLLVPGKDISV